jgi:peptidoglycan/xylan/chitin deacetylase (PgdA/CDA1 family)
LSYSDIKGNGKNSKLKRLARKLFDITGNFLLRPPISGYGFIATHGPRSANKKQVALTFDDGPLEPTTARLLDVLAELDVKATFFLIGTNASLNKDLVQRIRDNGHIIGNHSLTHERKPALLLRDSKHLEESGNLFASLTGGGLPTLYRAPWGWLTPWEIRRLKRYAYHIVGWDVDSRDWLVPQPSGQIIAKYTLSKVRPGSIILMHDGLGLRSNEFRQGTIEATKLIIQELKSQGYNFVTIPDLLGFN